MPGRQEHKFVINTSLIPDLRREISPYVIPDNHLALQQSNRYEIRSIYFDTFGLQDYYEKVFGIQKRKKLRVRGYNQEKNDSEVFLEIKRKDNMFVSKDRAPIHYSKLIAFLESGDLDNYFPHRADFPKARKSANNFLFYLRRKSMVPLNLVTYNREAYVGKFNHTDRVTFDSNIRSKMFPNLGDLYTDEGLKVFMDRNFVLEFKSEQPLPNWFQQIILKHNLKRQAYSKYAHGIDAHYMGSKYISVNEVIAMSQP